MSERQEVIKMKKVLVLVALCLALFTSVGFAQRQVTPTISYDETSIYVSSNVEYKELGFTLIENYKGTTHIVEYYWHSTSDYIIYRYKQPGEAKWSRWYGRNPYTSSSAQCLVFRDAWYVIKGYAFS